MENESGKITKWEDLGICTWLIKTCKELGMSAPTPIQENCIPQILKGNDIIGAAPTGSGKTAAFALPIIQKLSEDPFGPFAVIITPTRELAFQIGDQFSAIGAPMGIKVEVIIGGKDMMIQSLALAKKPHIIVATPGRLFDHLNSNSSFTLNRIKFLVLDEADRLLENDTLFTPIQEIISRTSKNRSTLLFSATMNPSEEKLAQLSLRSPFSYSVGATLNTVETLKQDYLFIPLKVKDCYLVYLLRLEEKEEEGEDEEENGKSKKGSKKKVVKKGKGKKRDFVQEVNFLEEKDDTITTIIVFTKTCHTAQLLHEMCKELGIVSAPLHSELSQAERLKSLDSFKSGRVKVLISTDVASRGLDIPTVELVINFDLPRMVEDYIHRVGRTARAGRGGRAISIVTQYDTSKVQEIEKAIGKQMEEYAPNEEEVLRHMNETTTAKAIASIRLEEGGFGEKTKKRKIKNEMARGFESGEKKKKVKTKGTDGSTKKRVKS